MNSNEEYLDFDQAFKIVKCCKLNFKSTRTIEKYGLNCSYSDKEILGDKKVVLGLMNRFQTKERLLIAVGSFLVREPTRWIGDILQQDDELYFHAKNWSIRPRFMFSCELKELVNESLYDTLQPDNVLRLLMTGRMTPEFYVAINRIVPLGKMLDSQLKDHYIWPSLSKRLERYKPFLKSWDDETAKDLKNLLTQYNLKKPE